MLHRVQMVSMRSDKLFSACGHPNVKMENRMVRPEPILSHLRGLLEHQILAHLIQGQIHIFLVMPKTSCISSLTRAACCHVHLGNRAHFG